MVPTGSVAMNRRSFLTGLIAAPVIVPFKSLMPVKLVDWWSTELPTAAFEYVTRHYETSVYADEVLKYYFVEESA